MSKTAGTLVFKFVMTLLIALLTLSLFDSNPWPIVTLFALVAAAANYLVGDLVVLPAAGNITASIGDGVMAGLIAYIMDLASLGFRTTLGTLVALGLFIALGEYLFHQYLENTPKVAP